MAAEAVVTMAAEAVVVLNAILTTVNQDNLGHIELSHLQGQLLVLPVLHHLHRASPARDPTIPIQLIPTLRQQHHDVTLHHHLLVPTRAVLSVSVTSTRHRTMTMNTVFFKVTQALVTVENTEQFTPENVEASRCQQFIVYVQI